VIESDPSEMLEYVRHIKRYAIVKPRIYWCEFPFLIIIAGSRQKFCLGYRPEDLAYIDTIGQKSIGETSSLPKPFRAVPT